MNNLKPIKNMKDLKIDIVVYVCRHSAKEKKNIFELGMVVQIFSFNKHIVANIKFLNNNKLIQVSQDSLNISKNIFIADKIAQLLYSE